ncbi:response regulator [Phormidium sp. CLA17]|uniref:hybrid sensor histidine kinase/response regulator n=1 Tax=Leptolyngbya sp. Cla-17 TaxID=2803751 RepID=UPI001492D51A|nr:hybrid sensor histidine kinase/response regulator [Leptolyngbya sp. Cla-17]MBM0741415.1 response regulator [Leptolyngbya sp. Cla-17]
MEETLKILVVDDDAVDRMAVRRSLTMAEVEMSLSEAVDCSTAIAELKKIDFDCIFLDYRLPDRDGLSLIEELRHDNVRTPIIVLTGQGDEQIAVDLMKAGATDYLPKSKVSPDRLSRILRNAVRLYRLEQEAEAAKQEQEQLSRQREDFVYRLTHDLRTPLVAADRMLTLFKQEAFGEISPDMMEAIAMMVHSNQSLLHMVNSILEVYRHDAGHKTLSFFPCDLQPILKAIVTELTPLAEEKGLSMTLHIDSEGTGHLMTVVGDCLELRRLFANLIGNAIKFTDTGSIDLYVTGSSGGDPQHTLLDTPWVMVQVKDTGSGISLEDQESLFERFRQGESKRSGSGLGLYLSRRIVEAHQGAIAAQSEPGKGSIFTVCLPSAHEIGTESCAAIDDDVETSPSSPL